MRIKFSTGFIVLIYLDDK